MKITVLSENISNLPNLQAEHGLSLFIETNGKKILFDMGQSDVFIKNAAFLGIDLAKIDFAVLSHGHYDHGGGIKSFFDVNKTAKVYLSTHAFEPHYSSNGYIGLDISLKDNYRFIPIGDAMLINESMRIIPAETVPTSYAVEHYGLKAIENNALIPDSFRHELYLEIVENGKKILISGCSHKGIFNIVSYFKPDVLVGGFHFMKIATDCDGVNKLINSARILSEYDTLYYTCHCTGVKQFEILKEQMGDKLHYISTGTTIEQ